MHRLYFATLGFLLCVSSAVAQAQNPQQKPPAQSAAATVRTSAQEVLLDMVVRNKSGKTIHDIRPDEVHVFEDGVEQKLTSFRLVQGSTTLSSQATPAVTAKKNSLQLDPMRQVRLVTLVFQGLDQDGKRFFRQALKDVLNMAPQQNLYFAIYVIDQRLYCVQPFTNDHETLLKSAKRSAMWNYVKYASESKNIESRLHQVISGGEPQLTSTGGPGGGGPSPSQIQSYVEYQMAKMQYDMLTIADQAERQYDARSTISGLLALVQAEKELPGRKVVLYFNPWLYIPQMIQEAYKYVISEANRANVSFYTVDPRGLVSGGQGAGRAGGNMQSAMGGESEGSIGQLGGALGEIRNQQLKGGVGEVSAAQARAIGNAVNAMRADPLLWLRDLAEQTGGVAIANTNDYRAPLRTAMDEVRTYFEATYIPQISAYDGKFHKISVTVDRPGVTVLSRSGYFALPPVKGGQQMSAYEVPLLRALDASPAPQDVPFQAAAERFNGHGPKIEYMLTLQAPLKDLMFVPQSDQKTAVVDAALLAVVKNSDGDIVENFSKDFAVRVALNKVDNYKAGDLVQSFRAELPPGEYTLDAVVMDRNNNKIGVQQSSLKVPEPSNKLSISDVVVVRRTEKVDGSQTLNAFYYPGGKVVPSLTHTLKGGPGNMLPFYFTVYPDPKIKDAPKLVMNFYKEGQFLGAAQAALPPVQQDGRIPYIADLPADKFTPGSYEIRIGVVQGDAKAEQKVEFHVN